MKKQKLVWKKPKCETITKEVVHKVISVSACSKYIDLPLCSPHAYYIDSIPGGGKPERE